MKRILIISFVILLMISMAIPVAATIEESVIQPRWSYFTAISASLDINWLGVATYSGSAQVSGAYNVKTVVQLQQLKNGSWTTLDTLSFTGLVSAAGQGRLAVERGYTYQAYVVAYVYDANGSILESVTTTDTFVF